MRRLLLNLSFVHRFRRQTTFFGAFGYRYINRARDETKKWTNRCYHFQNYKMYYDLLSTLLRPFFYAYTKRNFLKRTEWNSASFRDHPTHEKYMKFDIHTHTHTHLRWPMKREQRRRKTKRHRYQLLYRNANRWICIMNGWYSVWPANGKFLVEDKYCVSVYTVHKLEPCQYNIL